MDRPVMVLMHVPWETPALIETALGDVPTLRRTIVNEHEPLLPALSDIGGLVVMGGPQDANDDARYPGLAVERRLLARAVEAEVPVVGVCLGMQLLALALGAKLHLRHGEEIGFGPVELTEAGRADPFFQPFTRLDDVQFLHWHFDAVELPPGASLLARSASTPVQAFRLGSALGTQFHPEADGALLDSWLGEESMVRGLSSERSSQIKEQANRLLPQLREPAIAGYGDFVAAVRDRRGR